MFAIAIHGGAGTMPRADMSADAERRYRAGLKEAIDAGFAELAAGGTSMDAVTRAVVLLEDNPLFNAGKGAVFTLDGRNELDASIMDGSTLKAGAVCGVTRIRNPVQLARAVMEKSEQVMLAGTGAEEFAAAQGFSFVPQSYFHTPERWMQLERIRAGDTGLSPLTISHIGTVGAVAVDARGRLAAATSTGGMTESAINASATRPSSAPARTQTIARAPYPPRDMAKYLFAPSWLTTSARECAMAAAASAKRCARSFLASYPPWAAREASSRSTRTERSPSNSIPKACFAPAADGGKRCGSESMCLRDDGASRSGPFSWSGIRLPSR
jgi:hypothetical protein